MDVKIELPQHYIEIGLEAALAESSDEVVLYKIYGKSLSAMAAVASERLRLFNEG
jgi:hypothetical protein